jgi:transcription elongation factor GreB
MAEPRNYITPRGFKRHRDEYQWLRVVVRPRIVEEVAYAASLGDRSENAEYIYGKKKLREVDRRLRFLARRMGACEVVDPAIDRGEVVYFGATVTVAYPDGAERSFELVGEDEVDSDGHRVSWRSPMGQALMRRREGDTVRMRLPQETVEVEILEVLYLPQEPDPPSDWERHQAEMRARAAALGKKIELPAEVPIELPPGLDGDEDDLDDGGPGGEPHP